MSVIDPRSEQLSQIHDQMLRAPNFGAFLQLQQRKFELQGEVRKERAELARLAQGWVFVAPLKR